MTASEGVSPCRCAYSKAGKGISPSCYASSRAGEDKGDGVSVAGDAS